ncbi:alkene reductase [Streptomyces sp. NPDC004539]|uniref:oxidoreductase n=1 Tax=Streptomyces sp. NPDC004539 TaxID=3154280 RepID=UPI0033AE7FFF
MPDQPILRPLDLGDLRLPNRVVMAPVTRARATDGGLVPTALHTAYYAQRAGAGLIVTEGTWVGEDAVGFTGVPGIFTEDQVTGWRRVTDVVHTLGGRIVLQLWHTGAASHPDHLGGRTPAGPSAIDPREQSFTPGGFKPTVTPRAMTPADIAATVADYRRAAENARRAGFDGVEIQAVGSFLIPQFLNPLLNHRTDTYGTDRHRLLLDIVDAVAEGAGFRDGGVVGVRLSPYWRSGERFLADDDTLADFDTLVERLDDHPVTYLHLRGRDLTPPDANDFARYRKRFRGPLIVNNGFDLASANTAVTTATADAVSFGTAFISNPDLVTRFALGHPLTAADPATYYTGGAAGYVDYPAGGWPGGVG